MTLAMPEEKMMPLHPDDRRNNPDCPECVPFRLLDEGMARSNHSQSLMRLAERGGMGAAEILANMDHVPCREVWYKSYEGGHIGELNRRLEKARNKTNYPMPKEMETALQEKIRPYHNALSFKCGVVEAWEYLAPELERLQSENTAFRRALEECKQPIGHSARVDLINDILEQYPLPKEDKNIDNANS